MERSSRSASLLVALREPALINLFMACEGHHHLRRSEREVFAVPAVDLPRMARLAVRAPDVLKNWALRRVHNSFRHAPQGTTVSISNDKVSLSRAGLTRDTKIPLRATGRSQVLQDLLCSPLERTW